MQWAAKLPLVIKVPLVVAILMIFVGVAVSERVMSRLIQTQSQQIDDLANAYLAGLAPALTPYVAREDIWAAFETLERSLETNGAVRPLEAVVTNSAGQIIAATDPATAPTLGELPSSFRAAKLDGGAHIDAAAGTATLRRTLTSEGRNVGTISTLIDVEALIAERHQVTVLLLLTNGLLTLGCAALGFLVVIKLLEPMQILTRHLAVDAQTGPSEIPLPRMPAIGTEGHRLFTHYNALARAQKDRRLLEKQLAEEERLADLGRLASGMAHEINNPLGGLFNAVDTIKRHGHNESVRQRSARLIDRGLADIRDIVKATLHVYRPERGKPGFGPSDVDDVRTLTSLEIRRRSLTATWRIALEGAIAVPRSPMRQVLLNLVLNAAIASPAGTQIEVDIFISEGNSILVIAVKDSGPGIPDAAAAILKDTDAKRPLGHHGGLGLWMVRRAVSDSGGTIDWNRCTVGTKIVLSIPIVDFKRGGTWHEAA
ncbi:MAG: HAMP domain-containing sensor histidine kinase [Devosia sp.]